jgi:plastocyanin
MAKVLGVVIAIVLVLVLGIYIFSQIGSNGNITGSAVVENGNTKNSIQDSGEKTFVVTASNLRFYLDGVESPDLKVKQGDKVTIVFKNEEGFHDWKIDEFNAATKQIAAGATETIEFVADKKGTFEYYCSVGQHRANGMFGKFIVE